MTTIEASGLEDPSPRRLMLMRHAKSDWQSAAVNDIARPLNQRGRTDAPRMGAWMRHEQWVPERVLCSPAVRTRQTLAALDTELHLSPDSIHYEISLYLASLSGLCRILGQVPDNVRVLMLLGHNPGLEELLAFLTMETLDSSDVIHGMPTAAFACIEMPENWHRLVPGCGRLLTWMAPKHLPAAFSAGA